MNDYPDIVLDFMKMIFWFFLVAVLLILFFININAIGIEKKHVPLPEYVIQCFQNGNVVLTEHITGKLDSAWFKNEFTVTKENGAVSIFNGELCIAKNTGGKAN